MSFTEHQRFKQVTPEATTLYIAAFGVLAELQNPGATTQKWTEYVSVGNVKVGMRVLNADGTLAQRLFFQTDHLGSISVLTNGSGVAVQNLSYDAWGKRRNPNGTDDPAGTITSQATRGFTGEEELSVAGLIHLNGRVYDPILARFTSADPTVTDPLNPQGWNRYSYVGNDPLTFTDPNGYDFFSDVFGGIADFFGNVFNAVTNFISSNPIAKAIVQIGATLVLTAILGPGGALASLGLNAGGVAAVAAFGGAAIATGLSGGNLGQVLKAGLIAGATAFAFAGLGSATSTSLGAGFDAGKYAANIAGSAAIGCVSSVASGGSCGSGAAAAAVGSALSPITNSVFPDARTDLGERVGGTLVQATAGGLASVAGGGKFANGAVTGAFQYLAALSVEDARMDAQDRMLEPIGMPGRHEYTAGPNLVCPAAYSCSSEEMVDQLSRFGYPGQDPLHPVQDTDINVVYAGPLPGGKILTNVSADGLTITNTTLPLHVFCCGQIVRNVYQSDSGSWFAMTVGSGINLVPGAAITNQITGPMLFNGMDQQMLNNIQRHHSTN